MTNFPCEYHPNFLSAAEADAIINRFDRTDYCVKHTIPWGNKIRRTGVHFVSQLDHLQIPSNTRNGKTVREEKNDDCVGGHHSLDEAPPEVHAIRAKLSAFAGRDINYLSFQRYPDGDALIDWHRHSEDDGLDSPVYIVSTGAERKFWVGLNNGKTPHGGRKPATRWSQVAEHGSLIVLPAEFNDTHWHAVLKEHRVKGVRISINTKCLLPPKVWDCHAGCRYPGSVQSSATLEAGALNPAVYVGCTVRSRKDGSIVRQGTIYGNGRNPFAGHDPIVADNEEDFRRYAEKKMRDSAFRQQAITELRGKHLLCWCKQAGADRAAFCHARVWLEIVNRPEYATAGAA